MSSIKHEFGEVIMEDYRKQAANGKKWCYDCTHYYTDTFCGYSASNCRIYGSLDCDQRVRHPDRTADTCKDYENNGRAAWFEKYINNEK